MSDNVKTPIFRASFAFLFEVSKLSGKYEVRMLFKKDEDLSVLKAAAKACVLKRYGTMASVPGNFRNPFRDQGEIKDKEGKLRTGHTPGALFITCRTDTRPGVIGPDDIHTSLEPHEFYSGCWAIATVRPGCYPKAGTTGVQPGVSFYLQNVQKIKDDDPLGSRTRPEDDFEPVVSPDNAESTEEESSPDNAGDMFG